MKELIKTVLNQSGIHARPAMVFVNTAKTFSSAITVTNLSNGKSADAKSILRVMALGMTNGTQIRLTAEGEDEDAALQAMGQQIDSGLGEQI